MNFHSHNFLQSSLISHFIKYDEEVIINIQIIHILLQYEILYHHKCSQNLFMSLHLISINLYLYDLLLQSFEMEKIRIRIHIKLRFYFYPNIFLLYIKLSLNIHFYLQYESVTSNFIDPFMTIFQYQPHVNEVF